MSNLPSNLPQILRVAGLEVVVHDGWRTRGRPRSTGGFAPVGVLCHHTATKRSVSDEAVVRLLIRGRSDLPGPLAQLGLARDGTVHIIAAGRANHAGRAKSSGTVAAGDGNRLYIGIEAFNDGVGEPWPDAQYNAYVRLCAVLSEKVTGNSTATVRGHKETSVTGKIDPRFNMNTFRKRVQAERARLFDHKPPPEPDPTPGCPVETGVAWNCKGSQGLTPKGRNRIRNAVADWACENVLFIGLMETHGAMGPIRTGLGGKYTRAGSGVKGELGSSRLYIHRGANLIREGRCRTLTPWVGPKGGLHIGRSFPWGLVEYNDDDLLYVTLAHMPWSRKKNARAWRACAVRLRKHIEDHPMVPHLIIGDMNGDLSGMAKKVGGWVIKDESNIDYAIYVPAQKDSEHARPMTPRARQGSKRGSDHHVYKYDF